MHQRNGNTEKIVEKVYAIKGIISIEVHIGNPDILAVVIYNQGNELLTIITSMKKIEGIKKIL
jgi:predicted RNA-binding protein with EMAP domain